MQKARATWNMWRCSILIGRRFQLGVRLIIPKDLHHRISVTESVLVIVPERFSGQSK